MASLAVGMYPSQPSALLKTGASPASNYTEKDSSILFSFKVSNLGQRKTRNQELRRTFLLTDADESFSDEVYETPYVCYLHKRVPTNAIQYGRVKLDLALIQCQDGNHRRHMALQQIRR